MHKNIEKGIEVLCVHDTHDMKIGDRAIVFGFDSLCGHMLLQGSQYHFVKEDFVPFSDGPIVHEDSNKIDIEKVCNMIEDITKSVLFNQSNGLVPVDAVINKLKYNIDVLQLKKSFFTPKNKIDE